MSNSVAPIGPYVVKPTISGVGMMRLYGAKEDLIKDATMMWKRCATTIIKYVYSVGFPDYYRGHFHYSMNGSSRAIDFFIFCRKYVRKMGGS